VIVIITIGIVILDKMSVIDLLIMVDLC